jgi:hypothetical protein
MMASPFVKHDVSLAISWQQWLDEFHDCHSKLKYTHSMPGCITMMVVCKEGIGGCWKCTTIFGLK